jgi:hypothetical protein
MDNVPNPSRKPNESQSGQSNRNSDGDGNPGHCPSQLIEQKVSSGSKRRTKAQSRRNQPESLNQP